MFQEIKKNIKMAVLSEYKLIICILAVLIVFWKIINTLISESIVNITETVADNNMIVFLMPGIYCIYKI